MPTSPEFVVGGCPAKVTQQLQKGLPAVNESECDFYQSLSVKFAECISLTVEETVDSVEVVPDNRTEGGWVGLTWLHRGQGKYLSDIAWVL